MKVVGQTGLVLAIFKIDPEQKTKSVEIKPEHCDMLREGVSALDEKLRLIINGMYHLDKKKGTLTSLAKTLSLSRARVHTLQNQALGRLSKMQRVFSLAESVHAQGFHSARLSWVCSDAVDARVLSAVQAGKSSHTDLYKCSIRILKLTPRSRNALQDATILEIKDLVALTPAKLLSIYDCGAHTLADVISTLKKIGLSLLE